jgi:hypothetical protein
MKHVWGLCKKRRPSLSSPFKLTQKTVKNGAKNSHNTGYLAKY